MSDSDPEEGEVRGVVDPLEVDQLRLFHEHILVFPVAVADPIVEDTGDCRRPAAERDDRADSVAHFAATIAWASSPMEANAC